MFIDFKEGKRGQERDRQREWGGRETSIKSMQEASFTPQPGTEPTTQACALTGNQTHYLSVYGMTLQQTEPHWPGQAEHNSFHHIMFKIQKNKQT